MKIAFNSSLLVTCCLLAIFAFLFLVTSPANAQTPVAAPGLKQIQELVTRLINLSVTIGFMALTIWLVWGALKYFITSGGDPKALAQAWSSFTWSFMGIFFMVLAWLALKLIAEVSGFDVTQFCLGFPPYCIENAVTMPTFNDPNS